MSEHLSMNAKRLKTSAWLVATTLAVSSCGMLPSLEEVAPDNTQKYRKAETMPPLDVPPDLSVNRINDNIAGNENRSATYSEYEEAATNPLAARYNILPDEKPALAGTEGNRHLVVPGEPDVTWQRIENFWSTRDIDIARQERRMGLMDTTADADGYAYRLRMDKGDVNRSSLIYLNGRDSDNANVTKDEAMLRQLADFLGILYQEDKAELAASQPQTLTSTMPKVVLLDEGENMQALQVDQLFSDVWDRVGRVLDSRGFAVEDRDRSRGLYFVRYLDPFLEAEQQEEGFFSGLAFWRDDVETSPEEYYYIRLGSEGDSTRITVLDAEEVRSKSDTAKRLLALIQEQLTQ
ncbi:outer membrane protein assembly factor BamC [Methylophaga sp. OBS3]|uniref:outer membrane protein assembly factor BamC n=1 Tax=Methylophaga sp. OBS3 TaxID=2991934 RepID=UPI002257FD59|nr:outer membrane protein assembly factor BamC [Methylophaga sp. OBS3]MCX4189023.1 outer membrane protein assembly factor BamC [Methylophaga sp. OBS3]